MLLSFMLLCLHRPFFESVCIVQLLNYIVDTITNNLQIVHLFTVYILLLLQGRFWTYLDFDVSKLQGIRRPTWWEVGEGSTMPFSETMDRLKHGPCERKRLRAFAQIAEIKHTTFPKAWLLFRDTRMKSSELLMESNPSSELISQFPQRQHLYLWSTRYVLHGSHVKVGHNARLARQLCRRRKMRCGDEWNKAFTRGGQEMDRRVLGRMNHLGFQKEQNCSICQRHGFAEGARKLWQENNAKGEIMSFFPRCFDRVKYIDCRTLPSPRSTISV